MKSLKVTEAKYYELNTKMSNEAGVNDRLLQSKKDVASLTLKLGESESQSNILKRQLQLTKEMLEKSQSLEQQRAQQIDNLHLEVFSIFFFLTV